MAEALKQTLDQNPSRGPVVTDPIYVEPASRGAFDRFLLQFINDKRDLPFMHFIVQANLLIFPSAIALFAWRDVPWWAGLAYLVLNVAGFMDRFILMLHNTSHRTFFKPKYRLMNQYVPWVLSPMFGETPETYYAHHIGMHHPENNLGNDLSSTMRFQRDSFFGFARYFLRFFFWAIVDLSRYHVQRKHGRMLRRMLFGELGFYLMCALLWQWSPSATLWVFLLPFLVARTVMMCGNWGQHAFVDARDPANPYKNSVTVINNRYNQRSFNDGYHIGHHIKANRHWTEMPLEFDQNREKYGANKAIVFEHIDFLMVWFFLMIKRYDLLAKKFVDLGETPMSQDEIIALMKERTQAIAPENIPVARAAQPGNLAPA